MINKKLVLTLVCALGAFSASAQSIVSKRVAQSDRDLETYNIKAGKLHIDAAYKMTLGHDDNTTSSATSKSREEGAYIINALKLGIHVPINDEFSFDTGFSIGQKNWFSGDNQDGVIVDLSGDTFAFDWQVNETTTVSLVERLTINVTEVQDSRDNQGSDQQQFLKNDLGLQFFQELSDESSYGLKVGNYTVKSLNNKFLARERNDYYFGGEFNQKISDKLTLSPYATYRTYQWDQNSNNDGKEYQTGLTLKYSATEALYFQLSLGWQDMQFDGSLEDDSDGDFEGSFLVTHTLSETTDHLLNVTRGKRASVSPSVNFSKDWLINYQYNWQLNSKLKVTPALTWFFSDDQVSNGESYDILMPGLNCSYKLSEKTLLELRYLYQEKNSDTQVEYDRTQISMSLTYDF
ncbi:MAG: hypothetical protein HRT88_06220 [Lentisphaeraceae bacterium]|nr:hypothetical protein [Lentisphaeraceae bacterium]